MYAGGETTRLITRHLYYAMSKTKARSAGTNSQNSPNHWAFPMTLFEEMTDH